MVRVMVVVVGVCCEWEGGEEAGKVGLGRQGRKEGRKAGRQVGR